MYKEVKSAVDFISNMLAKTLDETLVEAFRQALEVNLRTRYSDHWFPEKPFKGSAFRCIRIVRGDMDKDIAKAWGSCSEKQSDIFALLPNELTLWVDPNEVSYRFGEEGSIGVLFNLTMAADDSSDSDSSCGSLESGDNSLSYVNPSQRSDNFQGSPMMFFRNQAPRYITAYA